jgi:GT2 family glycosyltransferase
MKNVAAIVVTHNRKTILLESIDKLLEQTASSELDIIIVDNASADGTREALASYVEEKKVIYLATGANLAAPAAFTTVFVMPP